MMRLKALIKQGKVTPKFLQLLTVDELTDITRYEIEKEMVRLDNHFENRGRTKLNRQLMKYRLRLFFAMRRIDNTSPFIKEK
jgi:hypothetical protein